MLRRILKFYRKRAVNDEQMPVGAGMETKGKRTASSKHPTTNKIYFKSYILYTIYIIELNANLTLNFIIYILGMDIFYFILKIICSYIT